jgi:hypothetical protein
MMRIYDLPRHQLLNFVSILEDGKVVVETGFLRTEATAGRRFAVSVPLGDDLYNLISDYIRDEIGCYKKWFGWDGWESPAEIDSNERDPRQLDLELL